MENINVIASSSNGNAYIDEVWKPVKEFENKYEISSFGRLKNKKTNHIYKLTNQYGNYFSVVLRDGENKKCVKIHRLVAEAFIPNHDNLPCVNHIDLNKQNNIVSNLEWISISDNVKHGIQNGAGTLSGMNRYNKTKAHEKYGYIYQYDLDMNFIEKFYSPYNASLRTGVCHRNILHCINHQEGRKQAGGYIWLKESEAVNNE